MMTRAEDVASLYCKPADIETLNNAFYSKVSFLHIVLLVHLRNAGPTSRSPLETRGHQTLYLRRRGAFNYAAFTLDPFLRGLQECKGFSAQLSQQHSATLSQ